MTLIGPNLVKRIHVNRAVMQRNAKYGEDEPAYTIQTSKGSITARRVVVNGQMTFDQGMKQLSCGARMYGVTKSKVWYE